MKSSSSKPAGGTALVVLKGGIKAIVTNTPVKGMSGCSDIATKSFQVAGLSFSCKEVNK